MGRRLRRDYMKIKAIDCSPRGYSQKKKALRRNILL